MPLSEVLAMYGYASRAEYEEAVRNAENPGNSLSPKCPAKEISEHPESPPVILKEIPMAATPSIEERKSEDVIDVPDNTPEVPVGSRPLLRSVHQASDSSDTGTDDDYSPDDDWRKTIQVGSDYQAVIPEGLSKYDDAPAYENEDRLLWDPSKLLDQEVEEYLRQSQYSPAGNVGINAIPTGSHVRDDEQALFLLLQCGHSKDEALRRRRMQPLHPADTMSLWSEDECRSFETGLKTYGKDFHLIQLNKVRTRAVGELVQFYYLWKKTERHDVFASKNRVEKKKYSLHPGTTDYMDRFLDEQENPPCHRDRSSSPNTHLPIFGENKKRTPISSPVAKADSSTIELNAQGHNSFLDGNIPERVRSPAKVQSGNPPSDCSKEYLNGDDRVSSTTSPKEKKACLNLELVTASGESLPSQLNSDKSSSNPPNEVVSCLRPTNETSRSHEPHSDSCNSRYDPERDEVTSIE